MSIMDTWKRLAVTKKVDTLGLAENLPLHRFSYAWTHDLLFVRMHVESRDCVMAAAIERASTSHGNHRHWLVRSFALKNPDKRGLPVRCVFNHS